MTGFAARRTIKAPARIVWAALLDSGTWPAWKPWRSGQMSEMPVAHGTAWVEDHEFCGKQVRLVARVSEVSHIDGLEYTLEGSGLEARVVWSVKDREGAVDLGVHCDSRSNRFLVGLLGWQTHLEQALQDSLGALDAWCVQQLPAPKEVLHGA